MTTISFVGDLCLLSPNDIRISEDFRKILSSEFNVLNFEIPLKAAGQSSIIKSGPALYQSDGAPDWVENNGWNVISLANNHALDFGEKSFIKTIKAFKHATLIGVGNFSEAYKVKILNSKDGRKIGFLACTHREFGVLDDSSDNNRLGCAWICHPEIVRNMLDARKEVDILIAYVHAGVEGFDQPLPEWRRQYKHFVDLGCDAVIASHPHVPQGWELYNGKPIFYSLGNFCFQTKFHSSDSHWYESLGCVLSFDDSKKCSIETYPLIYDDLNNEIRIDNRKVAIDHIGELNEVLNNAKKYWNYINTKLPLEFDTYMWLFSMSGMYRKLSFFTYLRHIMAKFLGRNPSMVHLLNNLQNESHRWSLERIIRIKESVKF